MTTDGDDQAERRFHARAAPALSAAPHLGEIQARREISPARAEAHPRALDQQPLVAGVGRPRRGRRPHAIFQGPHARSSSSSRPSNSTPASVSRRCPRRSGRSPISIPCRPADPRKKNTHASCWHVDLDTDIRSLQSIEPNPVVVLHRAPRARPRLLFHELHAAGSAAAPAHGREPVVPRGLRRAHRAGLRARCPISSRSASCPPDFKVDETAFLLNDALRAAASRSCSGPRA